MAKMKEFFGNDVADAIKQACTAFSVSQDDLDINILETGSAGIFGLCKKKAHIQVAVKVDTPPKDKEPATEKSKPNKKNTTPKQPASNSCVKEKDDTCGRKNSGGSKPMPDVSETEGITSSAPLVKKEDREQPTEDALVSIQQVVEKLLDLMSFPSQVQISVEDYTVQCTISGDFDEDIIGADGRTLDSLQYLVRKMVNRRLPERMPLYLDVGNYRERRIEELCDRAKELAEQVKQDGKTQAIPALNPSERRVVHITLQEDKAIRSRSVGEGLFKKVLIYKPGKGRKSGQRNRRGRQGGRPVEKKE